MLLLQEEIFNFFVARSLPSRMVLQPLGLGEGSRGAQVPQWDWGVSAGLEADVTPSSSAAPMSRLSHSLCSHCGWSPLLCPRTCLGCRDTFAGLVGSRKAPTAESIAGKVSPARTAEHTPSSCHPTDPFAVQTWAPAPLLEGSTTLHQHKDPQKGTQPPCVKCCPNPSGCRTLPGAGITFLYRDTGTGGTCIWVNWLFWSAWCPQIHWIRPEVCCFGSFPASMASGGCSVKECKAEGGATG